MCSLQTCVNVNYYLLKVKSLTFWLWFDFCEVCLWEKNMLILLKHTFWFISQLYSKQFLKNQIVISHLSCLTLIGVAVNLSAVKKNQPEIP